MDGISTKSWKTVGSRQFYYETDGSLAYRLKDNVSMGTVLFDTLLECVKENRPH